MQGLSQIYEAPASLEINQLGENMLLLTDLAQLWP